MISSDFKKNLSANNSRRFAQYAIVGFVSYGVTASLLEFFYTLGLSPGPATLAASELSIIFNFFINNLWTFGDKKITSFKKYLIKFIQFNLATQLSAVLVSAAVGILAWLFGNQWRHFYLILATGFLGIPCNFSMYNLFIWRTWQPNLKLIEKVQKRLG